MDITKLRPTQGHIDDAYSSAFNHFLTLLTYSLLLCNQIPMNYKVQPCTLEIQHERSTNVNPHIILETHVQ